MIESSGVIFFPLPWREGIEGKGNRRLPSFLAGGPDPVMAGFSGRRVCKKGPVAGWLRQLVVGAPEAQEAKWLEGPSVCPARRRITPLWDGRNHFSSPFLAGGESTLARFLGRVAPTTRCRSAGGARGQVAGGSVGLPGPAPHNSTLRRPQPFFFPSLGGRGLRGGGIDRSPHSLTHGPTFYKAIARTRKSVL